MGMRCYREPTCRAGAVGHRKDWVHRASSISHKVPGLDGQQEEMGAPLDFTPRQSAAHDANPELPPSPQRSS